MQYNTSRLHWNERKKGLIMKEICVTKDLPYHKQIIECFGYLMETHTTYAGSGKCETTYTIEDHPAWYIAEFIIDTTIHKIKCHIPSDPKDSLIAEYSVKEIWKPPGRHHFGETTYVGVTKWKEIDFDVLEKLR